MPTGGIRTRTSGIMVPAFVEPATVTSFTGPLDIAGSAAGAWGLRALKSSIAGSATPIVQMFVGGAGSTSNSSNYLDVATNSDGTLATSAIDAYYVGSSADIAYEKLYDQSGSGLALPFISNRSPYSTAAVALAGDQTGTAYRSTSNVTLQQPCGFSTVIRQDETVGGLYAYTGTNAVNTPRAAIRDGGGSSYWFITVTGGEVPQISGLSSSKGVWLSAAGLYSSASSVLVVNNSCAVNDVGAGDLTGLMGFLECPGFTIWGSSTGLGYGRELIWWNSDIGATARSCIATNQATFWGY